MTLTCFEFTSSSNRNVTVVGIDTPSENLRKLHVEMIWMCVIVIKHYNFNQVVNDTLKQINLLLQILQIEWRWHVLKLLHQATVANDESTLRHLEIDSKAFWRESDSYKWNTNFSFNQKWRNKQN